MKLNLNTILIVLGSLGVFAPDIAAVSTWLASIHVAWLGPVVRGLGLLAAFCSAAPLVVPKLRSFLALLGLATPPGAQAPWTPGKDDVSPFPAQRSDNPTPIIRPTGRIGNGGYVTPTMLYLLAIATLAIASGLSLVSCHNVTPDQFMNATVDCAKQNPEASAAMASVETCLVSSVSGNPAACLGGLISEAHFTIDEVACMVAYIAQQEQAKVAASAATSSDLKMRHAAINWLVAERIQIRNSYPANVTIPHVVVPADLDANGNPR
jgi:hypothetical protein